MTQILRHNISIWQKNTLKNQDKMTGHDIIHYKQGIEGLNASQHNSLGHKNIMKIVIFFLFFFLFFFFKTTNGASAWKIIQTWTHQQEINLTFANIALATLDICQPGYVIMMFADVLAPKRCQAISNQHADSTTTILSGESYCMTHHVTAIK